MIRVLERTPTRLVVEARPADATRAAVAAGLVLYAVSALLRPPLLACAPLALLCLPLLWMREVYDFDKAADAFRISYRTPLRARLTAGPLSDVRYFTVEHVYVPGDAETQGHTKREFILKLAGDRFVSDFKGRRGARVRLSADSWRPEEEQERIVRMIMSFVKSGGGE